MFERIIVMRDKKYDDYVILCIHHENCTGSTYMTKNPLHLMFAVKFEQAASLLRDALDFPCVDFVTS